MTSHDAFRRFAHATAEAVGSSTAFLLATSTIVVWAVTGPLFHYSDTWQLAINTGTTIVTFLMVFLIQNTQNKDAHAMHLKLDELIRSTSGARDSLMNLESMSDEDLIKVSKQFEELQKKASALRAERESGVGVIG